MQLYELANSPAPALYGELAVRFFGEDAYVNSRMIKEPATRFVRTLCAGYWKRMRNKLGRERASLKKAQEAVDREREGESIDFCHVCLNLLIQSSVRTAESAYSCGWHPVYPHLGDVDQPSQQMEGQS